MPCKGLTWGVHRSRRAPRAARLVETAKSELAPERVFVHVRLLPGLVIGRLAIPLVGRVVGEGVDLAADASQAEQMRRILEQCPQLHVAIGHFGMVSRGGWPE